MQKRENFLGVDILRFCAALMVLAYHLAYKSWSLDHYVLNDKLGVTPGIWWWSGFTWFGWVGVQVFFVISGFVIAFSSEAASPVKFIKSRVMRLAPAMWISASICLLIALYLDLFPAPTALYLFAKSLVFAFQGPWIAGQIWTLPIELAFYALVLLLLCFDQFRRLDWLALALAVASALYWGAIEAGFEDTHGRLTQLLLLQHGCYFALGAAMWICTKRGLTPFTLLLIGLSVLPVWSQIKATLIAEAPEYGLEQRPLVPFLTWLLLVALMALSIACNRVLNNVLGGGAFIRSLGRMTYPLYLVHFHVGGLVMVAAYLAGVSPAMSILLALAASVIVAYAIADFMEKPIAVWLGQLVQRAADTLMGRLGHQSFLFRSTRNYKEKPGSVAG